MTTTLAPPHFTDGESLVLDDIDWTTYEALLQALDGRHIRLNYDRGRLEIMTTGSQHERWKKILARFFETFTLESNIPIASLGNFTLKRRIKRRGLEPDECWYIAHEAEVRALRQINLEVNPPPDLVVEIEVSRSVVNRLGILASLKVPEVWRFNGKRLAVLVLSADGRRYNESLQSPTFPMLPMSGLSDFLKRVGETDETTLVREFQIWVRQFVTSPPAQ
ncbi:MAG: Uma2 family endonuclease [Planctomycetota bacterium]|nr:Uma2 family endonuclease [Planctomycetota bacterium]